MSLGTAVRPLAPPPPARIPSERPLRAVGPAPARRRKPRILAAVTALTGAIAIGAAQMILSIAITQGAYDVQQLSTQARDLGWERQAVQDSLLGLASPQYLAANASALGMVVNESPSYLRLSDAAILGTGAEAGGASNVDALNRGSVPNTLIGQRPLVTAPGSTVAGTPEKQEEPPQPDAPVAPPQSLEQGLPTPSTR